MKKLFFLLGLLYFSIHGSTAAEKNIEALRKYVAGEPGNLKLGGRTSQPRTSQPKASAPDLSTPDFSTMNISISDFFYNHEFLNHGIENFMVEKSWVEKYRVEISFNLIER